jgi:hypothetical protein
MKKVICLLLLSALVLSFTACGQGNVVNVVINNQPSGIYSDSDIDAAVNCALGYFKDNFTGCCLLEIGYAGDGTREACKAWPQQYGVDEVIILESSFEVDANGGDGSLNPNSTYENWQWILGRSKDGTWKHLTHGYG